MPHSSDQPWSNGPNAPHVPYYLYTYEKGYFVGSSIATVLYGIVVALFFQCMSGLLFPVHPTTKGVRWGLVAHSIAVFSFLTIAFVINRDIFRMSYINGREFTGLIPGPIGFATFGSPVPYSIGHLSYLMFPFNQWLADGLLLYRCFVIYSTNYWVIAFPSLMYLASIGVTRIFRELIATLLANVTETVMGILWPYHVAKANDPPYVYDMAYWSICVSLTVRGILTLMIIVRLALHIRNIRNAIGASSGLGGLYTAVITMLVESFALSAVGYILFIASFSTTTFVAAIFSAPLGEIQAISQFLIVLRVTNRTALTHDAVASGNVGSFHFRSRGGSTSGPMSSHGETSGGISVGVETGSDET